MVKMVNFMLCVFVSHTHTESFTQELWVQEDKSARKAGVAFKMERRKGKYVVISEHLFSSGSWAESFISLMLILTWGQLLPP